ncbi:hypothetical protein DSC45_35045 [Streptomyces sp. YIM 130001]|nr:hypothetical protein DSC45_35045 [Streptomyces sp. YIM 130001]
MLDARRGPLSPHPHFAVPLVWGSAQCLTRTCVNGSAAFLKFREVLNAPAQLLGSLRLLELSATPLVSRPPYRHACRGDVWAELTSGSGRPFIFWHGPPLGARRPSYGD